MGSFLVFPPESYGTPVAVSAPLWCLLRLGHSKECSLYVSNKHPFNRIVHVQDTYTNVYVQDTYTNVYRTHMHMHAYMHAYIHTLVGSGPLFPQSVLQCLCGVQPWSSQRIFVRRYACATGFMSIHLCVCVCVCGVQPWSSQRIFARMHACATGFMSARTDFRHEVTVKRGSLKRPQAWKPNKYPHWQSGTVKNFLTGNIYFLMVLSIVIYYLWPGCPL